MQYVYMGDNLKVKVDTIEIIKLKLTTHFEVELQDIYYFSAFRRNLLSISLLDKQGFNFMFENGQVKVYYDDKAIGFKKLCGSLYQLDIFKTYPNSFFNVIGASTSKRAQNDDNSCILWHKYLGHIFSQRMKRLAKDGILLNLDFLDLSICIECVKGKLISKVRKNKMPKCKGSLELIYTNICGPFTPFVFGEYRYFITFIDDFFCFGYVELIREKSNSLVAFKKFKVKMEL